ncbi:succinate dehydrogenase assembly factor 2 [Alphaproteobacteria bacterium LSUCC0684]
MTETHTQRVRRLIYRSAYTGTRETDLLLGGFARDVLPGMDAAGLDAYEELLDAGDPSIWAWVSGQEDRPEGMENPALDALIRWSREQHR